MKPTLLFVCVLLAACCARAASPSWDAFDTNTLVVDQHTNLPAGFIGVRGGASGGGYQTNWLQDINAENFNLLNVNAASITTLNSVAVNTTSLTASGFSSLGEVQSSSSVTATVFNGSGSGLIDLNAGQLSTGTIPTARLPASVPTSVNLSLTGLTGSASISANVLDITLSGGSAGAQTPWAGPINGAGYSLTNASLTNLIDVVTTNFLVLGSGYAGGYLIASNSFYSPPNAAGLGEPGVWLGAHGFTGEDTFYSDSTYGALVFGEQGKGGRFENEAGTGGTQWYDNLGWLFPGPMTNSSMAASSLMYTDPNGKFSSATIGSGLSFAGGTLSATGSSFNQNNTGGLTNTTSQVWSNAGPTTLSGLYVNGITTNNGPFLAQSNITNSVLTASTALVSDPNKAIASSVTTATELSYVHGVTSGIQAQINAISGTVSSVVVNSANGLTNSSSFTGGVITISVGQTNLWPSTNLMVGGGTVNCFLPVTTLSTNANFVFALPSNIQTPNENLPLITVVNTKGSLITMGFPANVFVTPVGVAQNVTNEAKVLWDILPGTLTNATIIQIN